MILIWNDSCVFYDLRKSWCIKWFVPCIVSSSSSLFSVNVLKFTWDKWNSYYVYVLCYRTVVMALLPLPTPLLFSRIINLFCQQTYLTAISPFSWEHKLIYEGEMSILDCDHQIPNFGIDSMTQLKAWCPFEAFVTKSWPLNWHSTLARLCFPHFSHCSIQPTVYIKCMEPHKDQSDVELKWPGFFSICRNHSA